MKSTGGKRWGRGAQLLDEGQGSGVLTRGMVPMCWEGSSQRHLGLEQEEQLQAEPGLVPGVSDL